jgi:hypothetical protein
VSDEQKIRNLEEMAENYKVCLEIEQRRTLKYFLALTQIREMVNDLFKDFDAVDAEQKKYTGELT